tara:strand:- start:1091 stop:1204 length:114 start_codon:yes stop_codon:yes gene_type:complete
MALQQTTGAPNHVNKKFGGKIMIKLTILFGNRSGQMI